MADVEIDGRRGGKSFCRRSGGMTQGVDVRRQELLERIKCAKRTSPRTFEKWDGAVN
jgi:hypothetical protein